MKGTAPAGLLAALFAISFGALLDPLAGQTPPDAQARVDAILAPWDNSTSPGCAVAVARDGMTLLERAYGMADLEHGIPNTPETIFEGGSLSKQFTSAAIVLLVLDGKLSLDDDIRTYVPEVPDYGRTITLRHLMTHTSGLRDWGSVAGISGWGREERSHTHDDVLDIVSRQTALNFEPGHEYSYSNTGYNLLAITVARVSGMPFAEFSGMRIFEPLDLRNTQWRDDYRRIVPGRSSAYEATDEGRWEINRPIEHVHGNGGILTTVGDLGIWAAALTDGRLGGPELIRMMHERGRLNDGSEIVYAAGLRVWNLAGVPAVTHTGSTAGYRAFLGRYPEQGLSVAMLCNASNVPTAPTGGRIARIFLEDAATDPQPPSGVRLSPGALEGLQGLYADPVTGFTRELRLENGALHEDEDLLVPLSDTELAVGDRGRRYVFEDGAEARRGFRIEDWQYAEKRYEPVDPWSPSTTDLDAYAGTYHSPDAETTYVISVEADALEVWQRPGDTHTLWPAYEDAFRMGRGGLVRFHRDGTGQVTGLSLSLERVYDMRFERVGSDGRPN
jgi:CubicO group peptidase (beta-lactamase class C family)